MQTIQAVWTWIVANWAVIVGIAAGLSTVVSSLITAFTNHPEVETWLHRVQGALSWVQHADLGGLKSPKMLGTKLKAPVVGQKVPPANKGFVTFLAVGLVLFASSARAQVVISHGPTIPLTEVRFADPLVPGSGPQVEAIAPGAGYALNLGFEQKALGGMQWDLLDVSVLGFATFGTNQPFQAGSLAVGIGTLNSLISVVFGTDLVAIANGNQLSGLLTGKEGLGNVFVGLNFGFNLGPQPSAPPTDTASGPIGLPRGNTVGLPTKGY